MTRWEQSSCQGRRQQGGHGSYQGDYSSAYRQQQPFFCETGADQGRFAGVAEKLWHLQGGLQDDGAKAYQALQIALQRHGSANGSRPDFDRTFYDCLNSVFPDAWDVRVRQIGGQNQWEVSVDGGPSMHCSIRMEVINDDTNIMKEVKEKARIVKDTLLDNNARWKQTLQPEYGDVPLEKLSQFERACADRVDVMAQSGKGMCGKGFGGNNQWVEKRSLCGICGRSKEEDVWDGVHMCQVCATFQCETCGYTWASHNARLKPDGGSLMGQQCSRCRSDGAVQEWHIKQRQEKENRDFNSKGMHQSELCEACREYGNCMGLFYDPFVISTALALCTGMEVRWTPYSREVPELLVADLGLEGAGSPYGSLQICLQPHVYVREEWRQDNSGPPGSCGAGRGAMYGGGGGGPSGYRENNDNGRRRGKSKGKGNDTNVADYSDYVAPALRTAERPRGGVKDEASFQRFLDQAGGGYQPDVYPASQVSQASHGSFNTHRTGSPDPYQREAGKAHGGKGGKPNGKGRRDVLEAPPAPVDASATAAAAAAPESSQSAAAQKNKFNKITTGAGAQSRSSDQTPRLDGLPPLRRAQFLQVVLRHVKNRGGEESDKFAMAEEFLAKCNGEYDKAHHYVKQLIEQSS